MIVLAGAAGHHILARGQNRAGRPGFIALLGGGVVWWLGDCTTPTRPPHVVVVVEWHNAHAPLTHATVSPATRAGTRASSSP